ncbi:MAG: hypothetical protein IJH50_07690, partial [Kiritimatiellae bacterium]|nr:hypothetical protein [Kiritimatiellia bacterium]
MKKLMTTISAAAMALSLSAVVSSPTTGTSFEGLTADAAYDITETTGELNAQAGEVFWETNAQVQALNVKAGVSVPSGAVNDRNPAYKG